MSLKRIIPRIALLCLLVGNTASLQAQPSSDGSETDSIPQIVYQKSFLKKADRILGVAIPIAMITYGVISIESDALKELDHDTRDELLEDNAMWYNGWDDYFQYAPAIMAFGLKLGGVESKHKLSDMAILYALSNVLETSIVYTTKNLTGRKRPNDSNYHSFPSGHTATAFVAAEFLHQEYKDKSLWISVGGYGVATLVGISRVYNNKHWVSDVIAGAGIGILSTKIVYWAYPAFQNLFSKKSKHHQVFIYPTYSNGALEMSFSCTF